MRKIFYIFLGLIILSTIILMDVAISQPLQSNDSQEKSYWDMIPEKVSKRNAFKRFEWFYRQRALPLDTIPVGAIERARELETQKYALRKPEFETMQLTWSNIGPTGVVSTFPSQWGIVSGRVRAIAVHPNDPNIVYIGAAAGGIWKTTNGGSSWQDVGVDLASLTFGAISIDPNNPDIIYAGAGESMRFFNTIMYSGKGLYKSTNAGTSWTQITNGFGSTTHFGALRVSPTNSNFIFAALGSGFWHAGYPGNEGLWRSTDAGITWTRRLNVDDGFDVLPHPTIANRVYGATGGAVTAAGFYRSTDNGDTWTKITTGLPSSTAIDRIQIALPTSLPSTIYALIYTRGTTDQMTLYKSTDDGSSWAAVSLTYSSNQGWYDLLLGVNPNDANEVYIGDAELRRSTNGGVNFNYVGGSYWDQSMHVDFHFMVFAPSNPAIRYVGCDGGIYRSTNSGLTWINLNNTLPTLQYYRMASHTTNQNIIIGGAQDNGIYKTTNGGSGTWTLVSTGDGMECFYDYTNPNTVYASTQNGGLVKSTTGGNYGSFTNIKPSTTQPWAWTAPFFIHPTNSSTIYTATNRPWRSTNGGSSWAALTGSAVTSAAINTMAQSPVDPNNMILVGGEWTTNPPVYVSSNGGTVWTNVTTNIGGTQKYISRVVFHPSQATTVFVIRSGFSAGNKIYRSTNLGSTWSNITNDLPDVPHNDLFIDPFNTSYLYTANDLGVYRSTNNGTSWVRMGTNFPYVPALDFDYFNSGGVRLLRVATHGRSAYQAVLLTSTIQVIYPNGGESLPIGLVQDITWTSSGITGNVKIELSRNGGSSYETLFADTPNDGTESWNVTGPISSTALIRITSVSTPSVSDVSDANFSIVQPTITVTVPNGGENYPIGASQVIQWTSSNLPGNVRIELSRNAGSSYETLFADTPNDGSESWSVTGPITSMALVRITSVSIPSVSDVSDANFSIVQPTITVTVPNGGENYPIGASQVIQWTSSNLPGNVRIELSRNAGSSYETLFADTPNDGSESWIVTGPKTPMALLRITSVSIPSVKDVSDANFSIGLSSISGLKFGDLNGNGLKDESEAGLSGWTIQLTGPISSSKITDENGNYSFTELPPGTYTINEENQTGWAQTSQSHPPIVLTGGEDISNIDFGNRFTISLSVSEGWNMVSIPITVSYYQKSVLFPTAISDAFSFQRNYVNISTLSNGMGYWLKFNTAQIIQLHGLPRFQEVIDVQEGWNMIGSISGDIPVNTIITIPTEMIVGQFLNFVLGEGYVRANTLEPGKAYWVKVNQPGSLILSSSTTNFTNMSASRIKIVPTSEMPPPPPDEMDRTIAEIPGDYNLEQAYPNPFNPVTTLRYSVPQTSNVKLVIHNHIGQLVAVLVDEIQEPGYKMINWNASNIPSGVYFYRVTAQSEGKTYTDVKKMLLLK
ncbi:MAG: SdrD B-like domain-containing protein [Bacteroidota bacterium]|nr:SdrD B-like domain-containing protein [Bacteroidota bacterium]